MSEKLVKYILDTIVYYDVMNFPMTAFETWKYLIRMESNEMEDAKNEEKIYLAEVVSALEGNEKLKKYIGSENGYYFLKGRNDLVEKRIKKNKISEKKIKMAKMIIGWMRFVPYVRMVAIAGRLAARNAEEKSDWDVLVVLKQGRIFTGRFLVTALIQLIGKRRHGKKISDRICLNHFLTTKFLISARDIFSSHEYAFMKIVFDGDAGQFFYKKNAWIKKYRPNFSPSFHNISSIRDSHWSRAVRIIGESVLRYDRVENILRQWQKNKISRNPESIKKGGFIVCTDDEMAFWPNFEKQGPLVFEKFKMRLDEIISGNKK